MRNYWIQERKRKERSKKYRIKLWTRDRTGQMELLCDEPFQEEFVYEADKDLTVELVEIVDRNGACMWTQSSQWAMRKGDLVNFGFRNFHLP